MKITRKILKRLIESQVLESGVSWSYWLNLWDSQFSSPITEKFNKDIMAAQMDGDREKTKKLLRFRNAMQEYIAALQQLVLHEGGVVDDAYDNYRIGKK